jgi:hypothetical protein
VPAVLEGGEGTFFLREGGNGLCKGGEKGHHESVLRVSS